MAMFFDKKTNPQEIINELSQAIYNHHQWYNNLIRTLICQAPPDIHDTNENAHKECRFGQWYYNFSDEILHQHPGFIALGKLHQEMHEQAADLLKASRISYNQYDRFAITIEHMQLEIQALKREVEDSLYNHDALTGAITRISMLPILREQQELVRRKNQTCSLALMDLDDFKKVNDRYGHRAGDLVLSETIQLLIQKMRPYDKIFRYGGEEFLICMPQTELDAAFEMIERLRTCIFENKIFYNNVPIPITVSFGLGLIDPNDPVEQSIEKTDKALYTAKLAGKNCTKSCDR